MLVGKLPQIARILEEVPPAVGQWLTVPDDSHARDGRVEVHPDEHVDRPQVAYDLGRQVGRQESITHDPFLSTRRIHAEAAIDEGVPSLFL